MSFDSERYTVCTYDGARDELRLADRDGRTYLRSFENLSRALSEDRTRVRFAMNAGMFNELGAPIGLYVENGVRGHRISLRRGAGNFHLLPNGVFWQDANREVHVTESRAYAASPRAARLATQSGPMLVIDGAIHPRFSADGDSRLIRNGVGVSDAHTGVFRHQRNRCLLRQVRALLSQPAALPQRTLPRWQRFQPLGAEFKSP